MSNSIRLPVFVCLLVSALMPLQASPEHSSLQHSSVPHSSHHHSHAHVPDNASSAYAFGKPGDAAKATQKIDIELTDAMRFKLAPLQIRAGETVVFQLRNTGRLPHELTLGDSKEQQHHAQMMQNSSAAHHHHANSLHLAPGESGQLVWQFAEDFSGELELGCHLPGHYPAGMKYGFKLLPKAG